MPVCRIVPIRAGRRWIEMKKVLLLLFLQKKKILSYPAAG